MNGGRPALLVVEDDDGARTALAELLTDDGFQVVEAANLAEARAALERGGVDAMLLDLHVPDGDGQSLLDELSFKRKLPTIVMTAYGSGSRAIAAMRAGAYDYLQKPLDPDEVSIVVRRALEHARLVHEMARRKDVADPAERIVGNSATMQRVFKLIGLVAQSDATVLVLGESGTGKELVASAIHDYSARASGPFVPVNCAAVPESLLESELFGHEKGAYTNALTQRIGRFEAANGGTLFLDEVGELSVAMQAKLLRTLQGHTIERLGGQKLIKIDARVIAASNRDLRAEVDAGHFREDLFYRLCVVEIALPPLRERRDDIPALVDHFLRRAERRDKRANGISARALDELAAREWRGNVRELENTIERALVLSGGAIDLEHLVTSDPDDERYREYVQSLEREALGRLIDGTKLDRVAALLGVSPTYLARRVRALDIRGGP